MKRPSIQTAIPTALGAALGGMFTVLLSGRSWLWVGVITGAVIGWAVAKWEHFFLYWVLRCGGAWLAIGIAIGVSVGLAMSNGKAGSSRLKAVRNDNRF